MTFHKGDKVKVIFEGEVAWDPPTGSDILAVRTIGGYQYGAPVTAATLVEAAWDSNLPVGTVRTLTEGVHAGKAIIKNRETDPRSFVWTVLGASGAGIPTSYLDTAAYVRSSVPFGQVAPADSPHYYTDRMGDRWYSTPHGRYVCADSAHDIPADCSPAYGRDLKSVRDAWGPLTRSTDPDPTSRPNTESVTDSLPESVPGA